MSHKRTLGLNGFISLESSSKINGIPVGILEIPVSIYSWNPAVNLGGNLIGIFVEMITQKSSGNTVDCCWNF